MPPNLCCISDRKSRIIPLASGKSANNIFLLSPGPRSRLRPSTQPAAMFSGTHVPLLSAAADVHREREAAARISFPDKGGRASTCWRGSSLEEAGGGISTWTAGEERKEMDKKDEVLKWRVRTEEQGDQEKEEYKTEKGDQEEQTARSGSGELELGGLERELLGRGGAETPRG
ncbi:hypothetical protein NDU88_004161 [Pleurodeles waltl]|uniref:Uncharacterized protein n=1 Tax=Pleurodeles waltl TaxID=8319 RepID=A0AAV7WRI4_PLEWA|nr:hypothetical protein NDU88_004161 [Pleurodeles waltl]